MVASNLEMEEILRRVASWPATARLSFARRVLESLEQEPDDTEDEFRGDPLESVQGLLANGKTPPDDAECRQILNEERMRKYGP